MVKQKVNLLFKKDPNILLDLVIMVSPAYLQKQGVSPIINLIIINLTVDYGP